MATDAVRAVASIAAGRHSVLTRKQAATSGMSPRNIDTALRRGWLREPAPGVLVIAGSADGWRQRAAIVLAASNGQARSSHRAAATLHGLDGFPDPDGGCKVEERLPSNVRRLGPVRPAATIDVLVSQPFWFRLPGGIDARLHQTDRFDAETEEVIVDGLPCTGLARTLCDLGAVCSDDDVWKALISARRKYDLNPRWLAQSARNLARPGPTGSPTIRRLIMRWADEGVLPESWLEELMGFLVRDPGIPGVVRQHVITDADGEFVARVDAAVPAAKLAIEGHSREFHFGPINEAADEDRDLRIAAAGFETIYLGWYATQSPEVVAAKIRQVVTERLRLLSATLCLASTSKATST